MIIDTSALVAVARAEEGWEPLLRCMYSERGFIPAPVIFELHRVTSERFNEPHTPTIDLVNLLSSRDIIISPLTAAECERASELNRVYGSGNERGGVLNMLDLMVYATSIVRNLPILCTGKDFPATGAAVHPASRGW